MRRNTATRTPTARAARAISCSRCAKSALLRRMMLMAAAAKRWGVAVGEVEAGNHEVVHKATGRKLGYGELAADAGAMPVPPRDQLKLKDPSAFRYIGKGQIADRRRLRHDHRAGQVRHRHETARTSSTP